LTQRAQLNRTTTEIKLLQVPYPQSTLPDSHSQAQRAAQMHRFLVHVLKTVPIWVQLLHAEQDLLAMNLGRSWARESDR
jgi:hypothetical protein